MDQGHFRADIEGLRAVAVGLVLLAHVAGWPAGGFIGVDVFFVISGFLITGLLLRERARTGRISFRGFYVRRARRILPAAAATLTVTVLASWFLFLGGRFTQTVSDVLWAAFFGANITFARQSTDYFQEGLPPSPVQHFWSLAVEEQFYLVWPVLILAIFAVPLARGRLRGPLTGAVLLAVSAASLAWSVHATAVSPDTAYFSTFARAWELGAGALVAVAAAQLARIPGPLRAVLAWAGLAGVLLSAFVISPQTPFPGSAALLPILSAVLLVAFGAAPGGPRAAWALGSVPARYVGRISYSLYLWHWPVIVLLATVMAGDTVVFYATATALSLLLATVSFYAVEQPVLHSRWLLGAPTRRRSAEASQVFRRAKVVTVTAVAAVAVSVPAFTVLAPTGQAERAAQDAAQAAAAAAPRPSTADVAAPPTPAEVLAEEIRVSLTTPAWGELDPALDDLTDAVAPEWIEGGCLNVTAENVDDCRFGDRDAPRRAVLLGDSIAMSWLPGLRQELEPAGWSIQVLTYEACPNLAPGTPEDDSSRGCVAHREWASQWILDNRPDLVIASNGYRKSELRPFYEAAATEFLRTLAPSGSELVVVAPPPASHSFDTCLGPGSSPSSCNNAPHPIYDVFRPLEQRAAAAAGARFVDSEAWFCVQDLCPSVVGTTPVYAHYNHLTAKYAQRIAPAMVPAILGG
ncbi:acyltransferase family protein [Blastococcus sp. SYSU DS0617]